MLARRSLNSIPRAQVRQHRLQAAGAEGDMVDRPGARAGTLGAATISVLLRELNGFSMSLINVRRSTAAVEWFFHSDLGQDLPWAYRTESQG